MLYISQIKLIKLMVTPVREAGTRDYGSYFLTDVFYQCITTVLLPLHYNRLQRGAAETSPHSW